jgi:proton-translocating NAD(P)+ transhydrogenase subunit alpha
VTDWQQYSDLLFIFMLAAFLGFQLIKRVSPLLHSPLMSLTNAIAAVVVVGAILLTGEEHSTPLTRTMGTIALIAATVNAVSGFLITDRMLKMFRRKAP